MIVLLLFAADCIVFIMCLTCVHVPSIILQFCPCKYCCRSCYWEAKKNRQIYTCEVCGKIFEMSKSRRTSKHCYCSSECMGKAQRAHRNIVLKEDYAEIILKNNLRALIDLEDVEKVKEYAWRTNKKVLKNHEPYYYVSASTYAIENKRRTSIQLHRFIMNCPNDMEIDHINHNPLDNRKCNLRICTSSENKSTRRKYKWVKKEVANG